MRKYFTVLVFILFSAASFAGTIKGTIKDAADGSVLAGVVINIKNTNIATSSDDDGNYKIDNVDDGKYELTFSLITYKKITKTVSVKAGVGTLDIQLQSENTTLENVNVSGTKITRTENAVLMEIKKSNSIVSGISAAQIGKTMDRNAADVVKRIPGVTIVEDRFIVVRGLSDRYNTVWLNDASAPSSEVDKKAFSFDMIPSGLLDRILIYKTPSPELPGDFSGGMIKLYTSSLPEKNQYSISLQGSYRDNSTGSIFNYEKPSKTDWLGYDDGMRNMPTNTPEKVRKSDTDNNAVTKAFGNRWIIDQKTQTPDMRFNFTANNVLRIRRLKLANILGVSYSSVSTNYRIERQDWDSTAERFHDEDVQSVNKRMVGLFNSTSAIFGNNKIEFKNLYNQEGRSAVTIRSNLKDTFTDRQNDPESRAYLIGYDSRATYFAQLSGTHKSNSDRWRYNWTLGYTDLFKNTPDLRRIKFQKAGTDTAFKAGIANVVDPVNGGGRFYSELFEHVYSFNHQFTYTFRIKDHAFDISAGNFIESKSRYFNARVLGYIFRSSVMGGGSNPNRYLLYKPVNEIFADENVGDDTKFKLDEITNKSDKYNAQNKLFASFISLKAPIGKVTAVGGVRYEQNVQSLQSFLNQDSVGPRIETKFLLPSINLTYNFTEQSLVRLAYGKTVNRPEFREWSTFSFYDFDERATVFGSLFIGDTLKVAQIQHLDARWEWYPTPGEMVHAGVFYKNFKDPIQRVNYGGATDSRQLSYANALEAYSAGIELDARKNLGFVNSWLNTKFFSDLNLVANAAFIKSELKLDSILGAFKQLQKTPMQGQSPYMFNFGLFYLNDLNGIQGSLIYNVSGPRLYALGFDAPGVESIFDMPFNSLDFTVSKTIHKLYSVSFGIQNLLDSKVRQVKDINRDGVIQKNEEFFQISSYKPGRYFTVGLKVKL